MTLTPTLAAQVWMVKRCSGAVIVSKSAALNPKLRLSSPIMMNVFMPLEKLVSATKTTTTKQKAHLDVSGPVLWQVLPQKYIFSVFLEMLMPHSVFHNNVYISVIHSVIGICADI